MKLNRFVQLVQKKFFILNLFFLFSISLFAENALSPYQILMPKAPCVGDSCELKYIFSSEANLFLPEDANNSTILELKTDWPFLSEFASKCFIQKATLEHSGHVYTLTFNFIPWEIGTINFPKIDLAQFISFSLEKGNSGGIFLINLENVTVSSIAQKVGATSMQNSKGPLLIPGTTFLIILISVLFLFVIGAVVLFIIKLPSLIFNFSLIENKRRIKKLNRKTLKKLNKLLKQNSDDKTFCENISLIMRNFLSKRFDEIFLSLTSNDIFAKLKSFAGDNFSENQEEGAFLIQEIFIRTDYIRFAAGSIDSKKLPEEKWQTSLLKDEKASLVEKGSKVIKLFALEN